MKALTVRQPFAHLIAAGIKRVENRSWYTDHRGPLAIHAAKRSAERDYADIRDAGIDLPNILDMGAIVAIVNVVDCVEIERLPAELCGPLAEGPWCWILEDARVVTPIACSGKLGLWDAPDTLKGEADETH